MPDSSKSFTFRLESTNHFPVGIHISKFRLNEHRNQDENQEESEVVLFIYRTDKQTEVKDKCCKDNKFMPFIIFAKIEGDVHSQN